MLKNRRSISRRELPAWPEKKRVGGRIPEKRSCHYFPRKTRFPINQRGAFLGGRDSKRRQPPIFWNRILNRWEKEKNKRGKVKKFGHAMRYPRDDPQWKESKDTSANDL